MEVEVRAQRSPGRRHPQLVATIVVLVLTVLAAGCSSDKKVEPKRPLDTTPATPGAVVVSDDAMGYAVSIPPGWVRLPTEVSNFDAAADAVKAEASPEARPAVTLGLVQL